MLGAAKVPKAALFKAATVVNWAYGTSENGEKIWENEIEDHEKMEMCWAIWKIFVVLLNFPWVGTINQRLNQPKCETSMKNRDSTNKNWELTIKIADLPMKKWEPTQLGTPLLLVVWMLWNITGS